MSAYRAFKSKLSGRWHWTVKADNGVIIARSTRSYGSKGATNSNANRTLDGLKVASLRGQI